MIMRIFFCYLLHQRIKARLAIIIQDIYPILTTRESVSRRKITFPESTMFLKLVLQEVLTLIVAPITVIDVTDVLLVE